MSKAIYETSMSLDGLTTGPNPRREEPLGDGGERLHEWVFPLAAWREPHGRSGGETGPDNDLLRESVASTGVVIMGRRMFSGGEGPWEEDDNADGWWGDEPPFRVPVFVLTHHPRDPVSKQGGTTFTFVTDGIESALEQAGAAAGERNVGISGGASVGGQYLRAGLLDEVLVHVAPVILGDGVRIFGDPLGDEPLGLEPVETISSPAVTHLRYRVVD
jgi:dihydrofolate reductase